VFILADGNTLYRDINNKRFNIVAANGPWYKKRMARDATDFGWNTLQVLRESVATEEYLDINHLYHNIFKRTAHEQVTYGIVLVFEKPWVREIPVRIVPLPDTGGYVLCSAATSLTDEEDDQDDDDTYSDREHLSHDDDEEEDWPWDYDNLLPIDMGSNDDDDDSDDDDDLVLVELDDDEDECCLPT